MRRVDSQNRDGGATDGCAADENRATPAKVPTPFVAARVEQANPLTRASIDAG
jgi:hypothetical protein